MQRLWPAVKHGLAELLQAAFTEEVEQTWRIVFSFIISKMREGMRMEGAMADESFLASPVVSSLPSEEETRFI